MKDKKARKTEPPLYLEMEFGEALARYAQTKPEQVEPPPGKKRKRAKAAVRVAAASAERR